MSTTQPIKSPEQLTAFKNYYLQEHPNPRNHMLIIMGLTILNTERGEPTLS